MKKYVFCVAALAAGMSKFFSTATLVSLLLGMVACKPDSINRPPEFAGGNPPEGGMMGQVGEFDGSVLGEIATFDVNFYNTPQIGITQTPAEKDDQVANIAFDREIIIHYTEDSAIVTNAPEDLLTIEGGSVIANAEASYRYILTGTCTNGRFKLYSSKPSAIILNGLHLVNPTGAAINVQSKKKTFVVVTDNTYNSLTDGGEYILENDEKQKGCYYSKGNTVLSGKGVLAVESKGKNAIAVKGDLIILDGTYNLQSSATAGKCFSVDGNMTINGSAIAGIVTGSGEWDGDDAEVKDVSAAAGIKCDGLFTMNNGQLGLKASGLGGKGINGDSTLVFNGGVVRVVTTGGVYQHTYNSLTYDTSPKGIKSDQNIEINGGQIWVRTLGVSEGSEGIEAKQVYTQNGGCVTIYAADDALNVGYSSESLQERQQKGEDISGIQANNGKIQINDGELRAYSTTNDAVDANGTITINGGITIAIGSGVPEGGIDCDENRLAITGGTLISIGGTTSNPTEMACTQPSLIFNDNIVAGSTYLLSKNEENILSLKSPRTFGTAVVLLSDSRLSKGESYTWGNKTLTCSAEKWVNNTAKMQNMGEQPEPGSNPGPGGFAH